MDKPKDGETYCDFNEEVRMRLANIEKGLEKLKEQVAKKEET